MKNTGTSFGNIQQELKFRLFLLIRDPVINPFKLATSFVHIAQMWTVNTWGRVLPVYDQLQHGRGNWQTVLYNTL